MNSVSDVEIKETVNPSLCRAGEALTVPGGGDYQISRQSAHEGRKVVSPKHCPPLSPRKYSCCSFLLDASLLPDRNAARRTVSMKNSSDTLQ